jgi:hypothetical protein
MPFISTVNDLGKGGAMHRITIEWEGPFTLDHVIKKYDDGGEHPHYDGKDYGLYQIYGRHILDVPKAPSYKSLLYIGEATEQTFASRFRGHKRSWLEHEWKESISIHIGRFNGYDTDKTWKADVLLAERILIYTYSSHYNSSSISNRPRLAGHKEVVVVHTRERGRLRRMDVIPKDWE